MSFERIAPRWDPVVDRGAQLHVFLRPGVGDRSRSGGQWDIWEATYGPVGDDGYPRRIWDKTSGKIDKSVAAFWKEHYDLRHILQRDWPKLTAE